MKISVRMVMVTAAALLALPAAAAFAVGAVSGVVLDGRTGQPVRGAVLAFDGLETSATSDLNGVFQARVEAGTYVLLVTADGYQAQKVLDVAVSDAQPANVSVVLMPAAGAEGAAATPDAGFSEEITIEAEAVDATSAAMLTERKAAAQIVDNIGAEEIARNTGSNAASALRRVTGISLQDDKFVYVRGLGDRYSSTTLNGSKIPSTDFERKVVPLDLFATDLLEKVTVAKSYTADQPGDFVAGVVQLETKQFPPQQRFSLNLDGGYDSVTTGEPRLDYPGGVSFSGGGGQSLPAGIPDAALVRKSLVSNDGFTPEQLETYGEMFIGAWSPSTVKSAPYDQGFKLSYGNTFGRFGLLLSGGWDNDQEVRQEHRTFYSTSSAGLESLSDFDFDYGTETVRRSLMGNLAARIGDNSQVRLRSLGTTLSESEGRFQDGFLTDSANNIRDYRLAFKEQDVTSNQLSGDHFLSGLGAGGALIEWRGAYSEATTAENLRETLYEDVGKGVYSLTNLGQSGFLYFNDLTDDLSDSRADFTKFYTSGRSFGSVKGGIAYTHNERTFDGRRLRLTLRRSTGLDLTLPPEELYTAENINPTQFEIREATNPTDFYSGDQEIDAGYVQGDWSRGSWRVIAGVRWEKSTQELTTFDRVDPDKPVLTVLDETDYLPALSVVYSLTGRQAIRASISRTVNRPDFRELAPFEFKSIVGGFNARGNPELLNATIDSYDLRWEMFPSGGEVLAASIFYKRFTDPIEGVLIGGPDLSESYLNAESASNEGFEVEVRKNLGFVSKALSSCTGIVNYTYVDSQISIPPGTTILTNLDRPLAGQPDDVVNVVLEWEPPSHGTVVRLLFNDVGDKVFLGGAQNLPDVIEDKRHTFDLVWQQQLWRDLALKVSGSNLTDEERTFSQGGAIWHIWDPGRSYSVSLGYSFK